jgi:hypothetical protein
MLESTYNFEVDVYRHSTGVISSRDIQPENIRNSILKNLIISKRAALQPEDLVGRTYVTFHESMVEFSPNAAMLRSGPAAGSLLGTAHDRLQRGLLMFNAWIWNVDAKDENSKGLLLKKFDENGEDFFVETQHDMGSAMGSLGRPGHLNGFDVGRDFIKRGRTLSPTSAIFARTLPFIGRERILITDFVLYRPEAQKAATMADAIWMMNKITRLSIKDLEAIVASSEWPDFMQKALVYRLAARRDRIVQVMDMRDSQGRPLQPLVNSAPNEVLDLSSLEAINHAARRYGIVSAEARGQLFAQLRRLGRVSVKNGVYVAKAGAQEFVLKDGKIADCASSAFIYVLEQTSHPSGLGQRQVKRSDDKGLTCRQATSSSSRRPGRSHRR